MIERLEFTTRADWLEARKSDVTASAVAALLGAHPWTTALSLYVEKTGGGEDVEESAAMRRGRLLEPVAVELIREQAPDLSLQHNDLRVGAVSYWRDPVARIGATPDILAGHPERGLGVIQVKSVEQSVYRSKWLDPDTREPVPPLYVAVQASIEAALVGARWAAVAPIVVGFGIECPLLDVPVHGPLFARVQAEVARFWQMVADGTPPAPDYGRDSDLVRRMYESDDGSEVDFGDDNRLPEILRERAALKAREADGAAAEKVRKVLDTEIIAKLGNAARGRLSDGTVVEAKTIRRSSYTVDATSYRTVKVKGGWANATRVSPAPAVSADDRF